MHMPWRFMGIFKRWRQGEILEANWDIHLSCADAEFTGLGDLRQVEVRGDV